MTEHEYEEWFDKNLGQVESLDKLYSGDSPFTYAPKPVKRNKWFLRCGLGFAACLILSFCTALAYETTTCWILNWLSNLFLNFSIGLIASLAIMLYTNIRDKNVAFYTDIIPVIEKRMTDLRNAYWSYSFKIERKYASRSYQDSYEAWHITSNVCFVIFNYICFLNTTLPSDFTKELPKGEQLETAKQKLLYANEKIQKEFFCNKIFSSETLNECVAATDLGRVALDDLERFLATINSNLYGLKYRKRDKKFEKYTEE